MIFLWKFAELVYSEIIKLPVQFKFGAYLTDNIQISIYPYIPEKVLFSSLIFGEHLIFPIWKHQHKSNFIKITYLAVQINLDKKQQIFYYKYFCLGRIKCPPTKNVTNQ